MTLFGKYLYNNHICDKSGTHRFSYTMRGKTYICDAPWWNERFIFSEVLGHSERRFDSYDQWILIWWYHYSMIKRHKHLSHSEKDKHVDMVQFLTILLLLLGSWQRVGKYTVSLSVVKGILSHCNAENCHMSSWICFPLKRRSSVRCSRWERWLSRPWTTSFCVSSMTLSTSGPSWWLGGSLISSTGDRL